MWKHDLFVSYASVDNWRSGNVHLGWVSALVEELRGRMEGVLGERGVRIWLDAQELRGNQEITEEITRQVRSSALLLVVLSPGYIKSRWCQKELELFLANHTGDEVFILEKIQVEESARPAALGQRFVHEMWYLDREERQPRTYGDPQPRLDQDDYYHRIQTLARAIVQRLSQLDREGSPPAASEQIGSYRLLPKKIGAGPYRTVHQAVRMTSAAPTVALAIPHDQREEMRVAQREAFCALKTRLSHPGLVPILEVGEERERLYVVYERVEGASLDQRLKERPGPWPLDEACALVERIGEILTGAHAEGIFHGRLTPEDIFPQEDGRVRVLDVGLFGILQRSGLRFGWKEGSEAFGSPEQRASGVALYEAPADVWALAVLAHRLLLGTLPPPPGTTEATEDSPLPEEVARVLRRALAPSARERYATVAELTAALRRARQKRSRVGGFDPDLEPVLELPRASLVFVQTEDPIDTVERLRTIAGRMELEFRVWTLTSGLTGGLAAEASNGFQLDPLGVLDWLKDQDQGTLLVLLDYDPYADEWPLTTLWDPMRELVASSVSDERRAVGLGTTYLPWQDRREADPLYPKELVVRRLREWASGQLPARERHRLLLVGPGFVIPPDLSRFVRVHAAKPAGPDDVESLLREMWREAQPTDGTGGEVPAWFPLYALHAAGLPAATLRGSLRRSVLRHGRLTEACLEDLWQEKEQIVRQSGLLEMRRPTCRFGEHAVGVDLLRKWVEERRDALRSPVLTGFLEPPRGVLLGGLPGSGKSLCAEVIAGELGWPLLRFDLGRAFTGVLGGAEENTRAALGMAEMLSPAVLCVDDVDRMFGQPERAGETTMRVLQTLLTWLQERRNFTFLVATATDDRRIPAELVRARRFGAAFFLDFPSSEERSELLRHALVRNGRPTEGYDFEDLARRTGYSSRADLVGGVESALFAAAAEGRLAPTPGELAAAVIPRDLNAERIQELDEIRARWLSFALPASSPGRPTLVQALSGLGAHP